MGKRIVVCMVCDIVSDYSGGFLKSVLRIAQGFDKKKFKVIFIAGKDKSSGKGGYINDMKVYRFPSIIIPKTKGKVCIAIPSSRKIEEIMIKEKVDVVHIQTPLFLGYSTIKVAHKLRLPVIITSHTQPENWLLNVPLANKKALVHLLYNLFIKMYNKADLLICVSDFGRKLLEKNNIKNEIKVISNGIDLARFKPMNTYKFDKKFGIAHSRYKYILYVGRLMKEKNIEAIIQSMNYIIKKLPNTRLLIAGEGYRENLLKRKANNLSLNRYIKFLGFLSEEDLPFSFASCDVFVLPSLIELQGMVLLEAMASGKALIVANSPDSASPYLVNGNGLLFNPHSSIDLSKKIIKILSNPKLRDKMQKKSLELIKKHDIKYIIKEHEKIYTRLCNTKIR